MQNFNPKQFRYSRQTAIPALSLVGQESLLRAKVLVVGCGGLGHPVLAYLAGAGVGTIGIVDDDQISLDNLGRQFLFHECDVGGLKTAVLAETLRKINSEIEIRCHNMRVDVSNIDGLMRGYDLVVDATDNFEARYAISDAALAAGIPHVWGAVYRYEGSAAVFPPDRSLNYRSYFPETPPMELSPTCATGGVLGPVCGFIGSLMAFQAVELITSKISSLLGKVAFCDASTMTLRVWDIEPDDGTEVTSDEIVMDLTLAQSELESFMVEENTLLVDVREEEERTMGSIEPSIHVPLSAVWKWVRDNAPTDKRVIFYCASGVRSAQAVEIMMKVSNLGSMPLSLAGGYSAYLSSRSGR